MLLSRLFLDITDHSLYCMQPVLYLVYLLLPTKKYAYKNNRLE